MNKDKLPFAFDLRYGRPTGLSPKTPAPIDVAALRRLQKSLAFWAVEMKRSADAMAEAGAPVTVVDGNRVLASVLLEADTALPALLRAVEERDALLAACDAKNALLACYRIGKSPSDALQKRLDKANEAIRRAKEPQA